ncbi:MAG: D-2-hydroxyacid dehydrogenase family protein [Dongiaceae bacterium]
MLKKIAVLDDAEKAAQLSAPWHRLDGRAHVTFFHTRIAEPKALVAQLAGFHVVVLNRERTQFSGQIIQSLPDLELIATLGMRNAALDLAAAITRRIPVCGTQTLGYPTVELTWALALGLLRHLAPSAASMKAGAWEAHLGMGLREKVLGVAGFGRIGSDVSRIGRTFGMSVVAWSRSLTEEKATAADVIAVSRDDLFRVADILTLHVPLNDATRHLVGRRELALMKPTAILINTSRGAVIDEAALVDALTAGRIRGAALDVFEVEPLAVDHPLRKLDNVLLTPHIGYVIEENYRLSYGQVVENIEAWLEGNLKRTIG